MRVTNNEIVFLVIILILVSFIGSIRVYQKTSIVKIGKATDYGYLNICINRKPFLEDIPGLTVWEGERLIYDVNAIDGDSSQTITFYDDTSLFDINPENGVIDFTAPANSKGGYNIQIIVDDGSPCSNSQDTRTLVLVIEGEEDEDDESLSPGGSGGRICISEWDCTEWGRCLPEGIQRRRCEHLGTCFILDNKPEEVRNCNYIAPEVISEETCFDGLKNQNEEYVDCGGICNDCKELPAPKEAVSINAFLIVLIIILVVIILKQISVRKNKSKKHKKKNHVQ